MSLKAASQSSKPKGILHPQKCKEVAETLQYFTGEPDPFDKALKHLVVNNIFLYYPDILKDFVFCDPQSLLTEIVKQYYKLVNSTYGRVGALLMFEKHAYISDSILKQILPHYNDKEYILQTEDLLKLLIKLNIISKICTRNKEIYYLMPALLANTQNPVTKAKDFINSDIVPPLCISFDGCAPSGLFCSLVAHLLHSDNFKLSISSNAPTCCYRNCVAFIGQKRTMFILVDSFSHFMIYISSHLIQFLLTLSRTRFTNCLSFENMMYEDAIECPQHPGQHDHVAVWHHAPDEYYACKMEDFRNGPIDQKYNI